MHLLFSSSPSAPDKKKKPAINIGEEEDLVPDGEEASEEDVEEASVEDGEEASVEDGEVDGEEDGDPTDLTYKVSFKIFLSTIFVISF